MPVYALASRVADLNQVKTQEAGSRALACVLILIGVDDEKGPQLYKVDPAGHYFSYKAVATGKSEQEAMNYLEKKVGELHLLDENLTIELAIQAMQYVLSTDFKGEEIEIAVVTGNKNLRLLSPEDIEERLNSISERNDN